MRLVYLSFTDRGEALAARLAASLGGTASRSGRPLAMKDWVRVNFPAADGLVFVGAAGIAVRGIAPYVESKAGDPAVVAVDEAGSFAVSLLSGHLGGANDLARRIAAACGAVPVITTATDVRGVFAADAWARRQNAAVENPERIKAVSSKLLRGEEISVYSRWAVAGEQPEQVRQTEDPAGCDAVLDVFRTEESTALRLVPRIAVLGVGCRKNTPPELLEQALAELLRRSGLCEAAVAAAASIDLKQNEPGLLEFCRAHNWPLRTFSAEELAAVPGTFTASEFVRKTAGVDNVCERSAVRAAGGRLIVRKQAGGGVTMAAALMNYEPDWSWRDE